MEETHKPPYESCWSLKVIQVAANRRGFGLTLAVVQRICVHAKCFLCFFMHAYLRLVLWGRLFIFAKGCNVACWPCAVYTRLVRHVCVCVCSYICCLRAVGSLYVCISARRMHALGGSRTTGEAGSSLGLLSHRQLQTVSQEVLCCHAWPTVSLAPKIWVHVRHAYLTALLPLPSYWRAVTSSDQSYSQKPF